MMQVEKYKHKLNINSGLWDGYKEFRNKYKHVYPELTRTNYVNICYAINKAISDKIIKESFEFRMPYRLGAISIRKNKVKIKIKDGKLQKNKMIPDWSETWKYWESEYPDKTRAEIKLIPNKTVIYNLNEHTNGYIMGWKWDKATCLVPNHSVYFFKPTKRNRLELGKWIKSDERENDYLLEKKIIWKVKKDLGM